MLMIHIRMQTPAPCLRLIARPGPPGPESDADRTVCGARPTLHDVRDRYWAERAEAAGVGRACQKCLGS